MTTRGLVDAVLNGTVDYEDGLDSLAVAPAAEVDAGLLAALERSCVRLFDGGWQPDELHRAVARSGRPQLGHLVRDAVAAHLRRFPEGSVDERWSAQAEGARVWWTSDAAYLTEFARAHRLDRTSVLDLVLTLLTILTRLPAIEVLVPPPGTVARPPGDARRTDPALLKRVRALLAKAESTDFAAEAETYTAKAQELIARHSIDEALLDARDDGPAVVPFARRIGVDHPYEDEKASLLHAVAAANHCDTVWSQDLGFSTVFGFDADIDAVDLLYTSLLVQANSAMARAEPDGKSAGKAGKAGRARLKAFRRSFLVAFADRIGERLAEAAEAALADGGDAANVLPVLASRDEQVRETMRRVFPRTVRVRGSRVDSLEGWDSGREAADRAGIS